MKQKVWSKVVSYLVITVACAIYAVGFDWFFAPNDIAYGGVTGIAQIVHEFVPVVGVGALVILFNTPLFLAGWYFLGGHTLVSSLYAMAVSSLMIDAIDRLFTFPTMEPVLASVYGGLFMGVSLGLVFREGSTTGGTDIAARLLKKRFPWIPTGQLMMVLDLVIICTAAVVFRQVNTALYGLIATMVSAILMDKVLYGMDNAKVAYIISNEPDKILKCIVEDMDRGVTILHGQGGYSGDDKKVLLCAFKQRQIVTLKRTIKEIDPTAFLIVCQANEVLGDGFHDYSEEP
jgi:uncharacterized membrane-anchored protein YitT (DUF2179 family)